MAHTITVHDKQFSVVISESQIQDAIKRIAGQITQDFSGKTPLFLCVLNGAFMFAADLLKHFPESCEVSFVKLASYQGQHSTGKIKELIGLNESLQDRFVVVIEDIVDTGHTMFMIKNKLKELGAADVKIISLLTKPEALEVDILVDYVAFQIPKDFVVGYGLDYDGLGRNFPAIYKIVQ